MNLQTKNLRWIFFVCLSLTLMVPALFPSWRLLFFAPLIVITIYQRPYLATMWAALGCGLVLDLFLSQERFGLYALTFVLTAALLYPQKQHFFSDSLSTLPIMTGLFSFLATLIQVVLMHGLERDLNISWAWAGTDLVCMPLLDGIFALIVFVLPAALFGKKQRRGSDYFVDA